MAKKNAVEETNPTLKKIIEKLKSIGHDISYPICVNTSNVEPNIAYISCNYMSTGLKMPITEIDFEDFRRVDPEVMKHCATWSFIEK